MTKTSNMTTMVASLVATFALASVAVTGFAGLARADSWGCAMPITKGGCAVLIHTGTAGAQPRRRVAAGNFHPCSASYGYRSGTPPGARPKLR